MTFFMCQPVPNSESSHADIPLNCTIKLDYDNNKYNTIPGLLQLQNHEIQSLVDSLILFLQRIFLVELLMNPKPHNDFAQDKHLYVMNI